MQNCTQVDEALRERLGLEEPAFVAQLLPQLMQLVRASRALPIGEEHAIRRGSKEFLSASKELGQRSMSAVQRTMRWLDPEAGSGPADLVSFNIVEDSIDTVLERVDSCIRDALAGLSRSQEAADDTEVAVGFTGESSFGSGSTAKPQVRWRELVDNDRAEFVPRLLVKHNQKIPLAASFLEAQRRVGLREGTPGQATEASAPVSSAGADAENSALRSHLTALGVEKEEARPSLANPYEEELRSLSFADSLFEAGKPQHFARMEDTPLVWVRTARELRQLINEVKATCVGKEIAVDVEHHDLRSYRGFTCLVQLSTRQKDFLIDPFDIFEQMHWLNEIFTDPSILKVLHGADRDVQWLQRDFSVYLVNMFDTGLATRAIKLQGGFSLANLVSHYCGVKLDKKYQTADWRQRPIPEEMAYYARCDTHYLLYCFDCLRNVLLAGGPIKVGEVPQANAEGIQAMRGVLDRTAALCMTQYSETRFDGADAAMKLCERFGSKAKPLESRQFSSLKAIAGWRDNLARKLDESSNFVAPDACLWRVALALPTSAARLRSTCNPLPQLLQQHAAEVVEVVVKSAEAAANADNPLSPLATRPKAPAGLADDASVSTATSMLPPAGLAVRSAAIGRALPQYQEWPPSSARKSSPIIRVSSGSLRHLSDSGVQPALRRSSSLTTMFESESSADEDIDMDALKNLAPAFSLAAQAAAQAAPYMARLPAKPVLAPIAEAPPEHLTDMMKNEAEAGAASSTQSQSLRDAYQLPSTTRRKKKKKKKVGPPAQGLTAGLAPTGAGGESLEAEAAAFRTALAAAFVPADSAQQQLPPRPVPTKRKADEVEKDPYAASADTGIADPYMQAANGATAAPTAVGALAADGMPRKKKKKNIRRAQPLAEQPVVDPYL